MGQCAIRRFALSLVVTSALALALAPAAGAATLYTNLDGGSVNNADEATTTRWLAQSFVATTSGTARVASFYGVSYLGQSSAATISIYTNSTTGGGQPGTVLATGPTAALPEETGPAPICQVLNAPVSMTAGQTYWAVLRGTTGATAALWRLAGSGGPSKLSTNSGSTWGARTFAGAFTVRVDDTPSCGPDINSIPAAGEVLGDMYAKPAGTSFQTLSIGNSGNQELTLTGGSYSGTHASLFKLFKGEPGGPEGQPFVFPKTLGAVANGVILLYIVCAPPAGTPDGIKTATLTLTSNDPDEGSLQWPVTCLLDSTPPSLEFTQTPNGRSGWFLTRPAPLQIRGIDPESNNFVKRIFCSDSAGSALDWDTGSIAFFNITPDGIHNLSCQGTDVANNTSAPGAFLSTVKVDGTAPETSTGAVGPPAEATQPAATFEFTGADATSGLGEFECRLDRGAYAVCTSPASRTAIPDGPHTFEVRARDVAGTYDPTPAQWTWRIDTPKPTVTGDAAAGTADSTLDIDVLANDTDPLGRSLTVVLGGGATERGGSVALSGTKIRYVPPKGFVGTDTFTYGVANGSGVPSALATVTIQVAAKPFVAPPPVDTVAPAISKAKLRKRKLSFQLSEAARVTVVVNELVKGRKKPVRRGRIGFAGKLGPNQRSIAKKLLKRGRRYRLVITAVDAVKNASKAKTLTVRMR